VVAGVSATRVLVVDDQAVIRAGLRLIVDNEPDLTVVGEAGDGQEAVRAAASARPDVVLMDVRMPAMNGIDATAQIVEAGSAAVLVLTTFEDDQYVFGALRAGASGFLLKDVGPDALVASIRSVARGDALVDPAVTRRLVERWAELDQRSRPPAPAVDDDLTDREREVLVGLARGLSNRDLAARLFLSEATVKSHVSNLLTKLGVRSRVQAVILAYERGVVRAGDEGNIGWE
jgi:DNA-binding NarL/FixJ family response regulator